MQHQESTKTICARFCDELEAGNRPEINSYLKMVATAQRSKLNEALQEIRAKHALRKARKDLESSDAIGLNSFPSIEFDASTPDIVDLTRDDSDLNLKHEHLPEQEAISPGQQIGRYKLLRILGAGGMGSVWLAEQFEPVHRRVALKLVRVDATSKSAVPRFEAERQAIAMMDHPNIAKIYDAGTTDGGNPFFVMELVQGVPLNEYCDQHKLSVRERLELILPVLSAIQHAHQKAIIHRDLKHSNVLVSASESSAAIPKVIDFGLAKALGHHRTLTDKTMFTEAGCVVGTLQYMSPEQADNKLDVDTRADIYSLGVMLYKLLTGTTPIKNSAGDEASIVHVLSQIRSVDPPRPSARLRESKNLETIARLRSTSPEKLIATIDGDLDWIVMKALDKDRRLRYETANGLAMELKRFLNDETVLARPPSSLYFVKKFVKRNRGLVTSVACIITLLVAGIIATSFTTMWALNESERATAKSLEAIEVANNANRLRLAAEKSEAKIAKLQATQEVELHAYKTKQAWSDWQLNNIEAAWKKLDVARDAWETRFLRTQFTSCKQTLYGHPGPVISIDASPNGRYYASVSTFDTAKIWNSSTDQEIHKFHLPDQPSCIRFTPDSNHVACADLSNQVTVWSVKTGAVLKRFGPFDKDVQSIAFDPDGTKLLLGFASSDTIRPAPKKRKDVDDRTAPELQIVSFDDGEVLETLSGHEDTIVSVEYSQDGNTIASASLDGTVRIWRKAESGFVDEAVFQHADAVNGVALSPSGKMAISGTKGNSVCLWNVEKRKRIKTMAHESEVTDVSFSPDGSKVVSCSLDRTARVWSLDGEELLSLKGHFDSVRKVTFSVDGSQVITCSDDTTIKIWHSESQPGTVSSKPHDSIIWGTDISYDRKSAISVSGAGTIAVTDLHSGREVMPQINLSCEFLTVSASPTMPIFASGDSDAKIRIWDLEAGLMLKEIDSHKNNVWHVDFSPDGKKLVSVCQDGFGKVWNTANWTEIGQLKGHTDLACSAQFSHDGNLIVTAADDKLVRLFDASSYELTHEFRGHNHDIWSAVFSPDDRLIASSGYDGTVFIWDVARKRKLHSFQAHEVEIAGLVFSRDGNRLLTGSDDGSIKIWDVETAIELFELREPDRSQCVHLSLSDDGNQLISGSGKGTVTVRSSDAPALSSMPLRPKQCEELSVIGLERLKDQKLTTEEIREELEVAKTCCKFFPYYNTWTNVGIAHCRLNQFELAEHTLREAYRQQTIQYGYDDLRPYIEGNLAIALSELGKQTEAMTFKNQFLRKVKSWPGEPWAESLTMRLTGTSINELPAESESHP